MLSAPFIRLTELPPAAQWLAASIGAVQLMLADVFVIFFALAVCAGVFDWYYGRLAARMRGAFDPVVSAYGWHSKMAGFSILLVLRLSELGLGNAGVLDTKGLFATAMAAAIVFSEIESLDHHRQELGARPLPLLSRLLAYLRGVTERMIPNPPPEKADDK